MKIISRNILEGYEKVICHGVNESDAESLADILNNDMVKFCCASPTVEFIAVYDDYVCSDGYEEYEDDTCIPSPDAHDEDNYYEEDGYDHDLLNYLNKYDKCGNYNDDAK